MKFYFLKKPKIIIIPVITNSGKRINPKTNDSIPTINEAIIERMNIKISQILKIFCILIL
jgi:hypothetical protein